MDERFGTIISVLQRIIGNELSERERIIVTEAIAENRLADLDDFVAFVVERDQNFAGAINTGRYLNAMLDAAKMLGSKNAPRMLAREEGSPYFLIGSTNEQLEQYGLADITDSPNPEDDEIIDRLRDVSIRRRATGCVVTAHSDLNIEGEIEATTGSQRRIEALFVLAIAHRGNRSALLPLDGGSPVWHHFTGVATGLERYVELSADLADLN